MEHMRTDRACLCAVLLSLASVSWAVVRAQTSENAGRHGSDDEIAVSAGDLLHVSVVDVPELDQHVRVSPSGDVQLPYVGAVSVSGVGPDKAAKRIAEALIRGDFLVDPQVSLLVESSAAGSVAVLGQVQHPGTYPLNSPRSLLDVISMAGDRTPAADVRITIRRHGEAGETVYATMPNDPDADILNAVEVMPGDTVIVPKAGMVYVLGQVNRPGGYTMQNDAQMTALQALALAAGTTHTSLESHAQLVRQTPSGAIAIPLDLRAMQKGKLADRPLQPGDVVYVPNSAAKNLMLSAGAVLSSTSGAAIYATTR